LNYLLDNLEKEVGQEMVELFNRRKVEINSEKCGEMVQNVLEALEI